MITLEFSKEIISKCPQIRIGCLFANVKVESISKPLWKEIELLTENRSVELQLEDISKIETILQSRVAYKSLGKDPSRYRLSADALLRRVIKGQGLYQVNNVVDIINYASLKTGFSIGGYDTSKFNGEHLLLDVGKAEEPYEAIGRGNLNIELLPVLRDTSGAFGSPTSDSMRTQIGQHTSSILLTVFDFYANRQLTDALDLLVGLIEKYADGTSIEIKVLSND